MSVRPAHLYGTGSKPFRVILSAGPRRHREGARVAVTVAEAGGAAASGLIAALPPLYLSLVLSALGGLLLVSLAAFGRPPERSTRALCWIGLVAPLLVIEVKTQTEVLSNPLTPITMFQGAAPAVLMVGALLLNRRRLFPLRGPIEVFGALFVGVALISSVWSVGALATLLKAAQLAIVYILILILVRNHDSSDGLLGELASVVHLLLLSAVLGALVDFHAAIAPIGALDPTKRLKGLFPAIAPDLLAFLAVVGLLVLTANIGPRWSRRSGARLMLGVVYILILLLTRTRTELAFLLLLWLVLVLQDRRGGMNLVTVGPAVALVLGVIVLLFFHQLLGFLSRGQVGSQLGTLTGRTTNWRLALAQWRESPFHGLGYYSGHRLTEIATAFGRQVSTPDNMWVTVLADMGLLGFAPLFLLVAGGGWRILRPDRGFDVVDRTLRVLFLLSFFASLVNPSLEQVTYSLIVFALVLLAPGSTGTSPMGAHQVHIQRSVESRAGLVRTAG